MSAEPPDGRRVAPSILAADFSRLGAEVAVVMDAGARVIHVDVMDGTFVPPITIGAQVVESLRDQIHGAGGWIDVHMMVDRPERHLDAFLAAGADSITVHAEATPHVHYALKAIREGGARAGLALNPGTPVSAAAPLAGVVDLLLCMTVNPGWGGQEFIEGAEARVEALRELAGDTVAIEVDGGIGPDTAARCAKAGADLFVAGSSIFGAGDAAEAYRAIATSAGAR